MRYVLFALALVACKPAEISTGDDTATPTGPTDEELDAQWSGATLQIISPASGDFLPYTEEADFEAVVYDAEGNPTDFADITWTSDVDTAWVPMGAAFADDTLEVGTHALTATAVLPNGDRLAYTIGGVLVQSIYAGTYTGTVTINVTYSDYQVGCSGATTLIIDPYGELVEGAASCIISLQGYELDLSLGIDAENDEAGKIEGDAAIDLFGYAFEMPLDGDVSEDGELTADFESTDYLELAGSLDAVRISRDTSGGVD